MKWNKSGFRPPLCTYRLNWAGEPPEDGEMIEMILSSRHRIRNSSPGGLRSSTLPLGHGGSPQYWLSHVAGEKTYFVSFKPPRPGTEPRTLTWKAAVLTTTLGPPPCWHTSPSGVVRIFKFKIDIDRIQNMNTVVSYRASYLYIVHSFCGHFSDNLKIIATKGFSLQSVSLISPEWHIKTLLR